MKIARISRYPGYFAAVSLLMFLLLISSVIPLNVTLAQTDGQFPPSIIASSSTNTTPHLLKLKGTQQGGTETRVSGFSLDITSAVSAQANSQLLVLVTDSSLRVTEAKVRTASNQVINLIPATSQQAGAFSLANLPGGVYTLDVITQKGNAKAAYGGILSVGQQPLTVIEETTKRVTNEYGDLYIIFLPPEECPPGTTGVPPDCIPEEECPPGTTGVPPNCEPICDVEDPPLECGEPPIVCWDGSTPPPGEDCPPDEPPMICPDGSTPPPGEDCPPDELPGLLPPENGEEPPENGEEPPENGEEPPENGEEPPDEEEGSDEDEDV